MRLAMAISPSRDSSSTEPISRRYMRTGSSVRSDGSFFSVVASALVFELDQLVAGVVIVVIDLVGGLLLAVLTVVVVVFDDGDAHLADHGEDVFDLVGGHFLRRQHGVDLVVGDVAAFLGGLDHLLDAGIGQVEQRQRRFRRAFALLIGGFFLGLGRCLHLARHLNSPGPSWSARSRPARWRRTHGQKGRAGKAPPRIRPSVSQEPT